MSVVGWVVSTRLTDILTLSSNGSYVISRILETNCLSTTLLENQIVSSVDQSPLVATMSNKKQELQIKIQMIENVFYYMQGLHWRPALASSGIVAIAAVTVPAESWWNPQSQQFWLSIDKILSDYHLSIHFLRPNLRAWFGIWREISSLEKYHMTIELESFH